MPVRPARNTDLRALQQLLVAFVQYNAETSGVGDDWSSPGWEKRRHQAATNALGFPGVHTWVATHEGTVVGYLISQTQAWPRCYSIEEVFVLPEHRGEGLGRLLLEQVEALAQEWGFSVKVEVYPWNTAAVEFYRHLGYGDDALALEKEMRV